MSEEVQNQQQQGEVPSGPAQAGTGVEGGQVAAGQGPDTIRTQMGGDADQSVERIVATRIAQREAKIREEERSKVLEELAKAQGEPSPVPGQAAGQAQQPLVNWEQLNELVYNQFMQRPAETLLQVAGAIAQQQVMGLQQKLQEWEYRQNLADLAMAHAEDIQQVAPHMRPILEKFPHLAQSREGLELAYHAARGMLAPQLAQEAASREREIVAGVQAAARGAAPQPTVNQQAAAQPSPEDALRAMIRDAR